jgi:hypothetical protein
MVLGEHVPTVEPGLTLLEVPGPRSTALHQVALHNAVEWAGPIYWVDARNTASTYTIHALSPSQGVVSRLRLARAFTAYQHVSLVERVINTVSPRTGGIILPNLASLYRDDDVPAHEAEPLVEAVRDALAAVADTYEIPVLVTDAEPEDDLSETLTTRADRQLRCERTGMGYRFEGDAVETTVYWQDGAWQTTIPYWVELVGAVGETSGITVDAQTIRFAVEG